MKVIETSSVEWQSTVLAVVLHLHLEARRRVELRSRDYKSLILATKLAGRWKGRRGSDPQHLAWKASVLPIELLPHMLIYLSSLYKYYTMIFKKNQIFTHSNSQVKVMI